MTSYDFVLVSAYSLAPAAIVSLIRYRKAAAVFHPFMYLLWIGIANELLSTLIIKQGGSNAVNNNIYVLLEGLLLLWQFYRWDVLKRYPVVYKILAGLVLIGWGMENIVFGEIKSFDNLFRMYSCGMVMLLALIKLTMVANEVKGKHYRVACTIICAGLVLYNSIGLYMEIMFHVFGQAPWKGDLFWWGGWANIITNILFLMAVLWIPRKRFPLAPQQ